MEINCTVLQNFPSVPDIVLGTFDRERYLPVLIFHQQRVIGIPALVSHKENPIL